MASTYSKITVVPPVADGVGVVPVAVSIKAPNGLTATAYTSRDGSTAFTFPATITVETTFYLTSAGDHEVSAIAGAQQVATQAGKPAQVYAPNSSTDVVVRCVDPVDNADSLAEQIAENPALTGRYRTKASTDAGNRTAILGDSIAIGEDDFANPSFPPSSWFNRLCQASGQRMRFYVQAGVRGNTTAQMLARVQTDVIAYSPDWCIVPLTTNDASVTAVATVKANYAAIIDALVAAGVRPICATMTPSDTAGKLSDTCTLNTWLVEWASRRGYPVWDLYGILADPADGTYLAANQYDGTHPSEAGYEAIVAALTSLIPAEMKYSPILANVDNDPTNLVTTPLFLSNSGGTPTNWVKLGTGTATVSGAAPVGNWAQLVTTGSDTAYFAQAINSGWSVGDRLRLACRWQHVDAGVASSILAVLTGGTPNTAKATYNHVEVVTGTAGRIAYLEFVVPTGTSAVQFRMSQTGAGTVRYAQPTLVNMTTQGLLS